ncbi:Calmodulin-like protein [Durusdinium trenchii]|uniref:Calmodulin-like protein n=1 Tax=Durusdinium trenchii TaxID=1381693 RepID=A0ABP0R2P3_9DINO
MASNAPTEMPTSEEQFQEVRSFALDSSRLLEMQVSLLQNYIGEHTAQPEALRPVSQAVDEVLDTIQELQLKLATESMKGKTEERMVRLLPPQKAGQRKATAARGEQETKKK